MPKKKTAKKRTAKKVKKSSNKVAEPAASTPETVEAHQMSPDEINREHLLATLKGLTALAESGEILGLVFVADGQSPQRGWSGNINAARVMMPIEMTKFEITAIAINHAKSQQNIEQPAG